MQSRTRLRTARVLPTCSFAPPVRRYDGPAALDCTVNAFDARLLSSQPPPRRASIAARLWLSLIGRHIDNAGAAGDRHLRLASIELRAAPLHVGIRRAFEEMDAVHAREALE